MSEISATSVYDLFRAAVSRWPDREVFETMPGTAAVFEQRVGDGRIVAFVDDPCYRGYWRGADRLFLNAVVLGPSAP